MLESLHHRLLSIILRSLEIEQRPIAIAFICLAATLRHVIADTLLRLFQYAIHHLGLGSGCKFIDQRFLIKINVLQIELDTAHKVQRGR